MKFRQLVLGFVLLYLSILGLYAGLTSDQKSYFVIGSSVFLGFLAIAFLVADLKNYSKYTKGGVLRVSEGLGRGLIAVIGIALGIFIFIKGSGFPAFTAFVLLFTLSIAYVFTTPEPGIYKNGKYLGKVIKGNIKVSNNISLGESKALKTIGAMSILKNGEELAKIALTAEGMMELKPEKLKEIFPEIRGNIETFGSKSVFKIGDFTVEYDFAKGYTSSYYDEDKNTTLDDCTLSPNYTFCAGNIHKHH